MNDSLFGSCYDPLFCTNTIQTSEHNTIQQIAEHDLQALYFGGEMPLQTQQPHQQQISHQRDESNLMVATALNNNAGGFNSSHNNIPFVQIHTTDVQPQRTYGNIFRRTITNQAVIKSEPIKSESSDASKERTNATPTPPVRCNTSNNSSERVSTPTSTQNDESLSKEQNSIQNTTDIFKDIKKCNQCRFICLSNDDLEGHLSKLHGENGFQTSTDNQIHCPGCSNIFYTIKSFETHLIEDHFTSLEDANKLATGTEITNTIQSDSNTIENNNAKTDSHPQQRKSRIYLKNVECLREPRREPLDLNDQGHSHVVDNYFQNNTFSNVERNSDLNDILNGDFNELCVGHSETDRQHSVNASTAQLENVALENNKPKQKISIKSVDVLREPSRRRDYEMQQQQFNALDNTAHEHPFEPFNVFQNLPSNSLTNINQNNNASFVSVANSDNNAKEAEKPRRPKIYIKNVDILKEPIVLPNYGSNVTMGIQDTNTNLGFNFLAQTTADFLTNAGNLGVTNDTFDADNLNQLTLVGSNNIPDAYLYESATNANLQSSNCNNDEVTNVDSFQPYNNNNNGINTGFLAYPLMDCGSIDSSSHISCTTPIITEPTPPPAAVFNMQNMTDTLANYTAGQTASASTPVPTPPQQKQKIFIKNVDILKEPQFQVQRERGTLHLRTVDELNLMNRNEVESLIAPNLEHSHVNSTIGLQQSEEHTMTTDDDENLASRDMFYGEDTLKLQDYATQLVNSWPTDDYDLGNDIEYIVTDSIEPINSAALQQNSINSNLANVGICPSDNTDGQKLNHELETPQMSMISIRDIEELTAPQIPQHQSMNNNILTSICHDATEAHNMLTSLGTNVETEKPYLDSVSSIEMDPAKPEEPCDQQKQKLIAINNVITPSNFNFNLNVDLPPLAPVTNYTVNTKTTNRETNQNNTPSTSIVPVPPLAPVSTLCTYTTPTLLSKTTASSSNSITNNNSLITTATLTTTTTTTTVTNLERGRIYVANNLMQNPLTTTTATISPAMAVTTNETGMKTKTRTNQKHIAVSVTGGTSVRGRPFGSNRSDNIAKSTKIRSEQNEVVLKCSIRGCAFRFKKPETLAYHQRCHDSSQSLQAKLCPECNLKDFSNWNTLHTHLWRSHQIDMELYSCAQCPFKTPIYSRLVNTHTKIHSEERNYKCDQCGKAFKNTKQLKNHRRWHRTHGNSSSNNVLTNAPTNATTNDPVTDLNKQIRKTTTKTLNSTVVSDGSTNDEQMDTDAMLQQLDLFRCKDCGAAFSHSKTLREHICKKSDHQLSCHVCGHVSSSKSSLKLHLFTHENAKRLKCTQCTYSTSDHNAFRRHKMMHENTKMYNCPHCSYKSIQSATFQKHVLLKHPIAASTLIHKCKLCSFSTVNRALLALHQIKHKLPQAKKGKDDDVDQNNSSPNVNDVEFLSESTSVAKKNCDENIQNNNNNMKTAINLHQNQQLQQQHQKPQQQPDEGNMSNKINDDITASIELIEIGWKATKPDHIAELS